LFFLLLHLCSDLVIDNIRPCSLVFGFREQFAANDPDVLLQAAKLVEKHCDAVDINLCVLLFTP
jgi:tRNA-dihydrouridine synthase